MTSTGASAITILGATGSIGLSTLDVVRRNRERYRVSGLSAYRQVDKLHELCVEFRPEVAVVGDAEAAARLDGMLKSAGIDTMVSHGAEALCELAGDPGSDTVMAAIVGAAGLRPAMAAAQAGKRLLLANKEALVVSGRILMDAVAKHDALLLPIDSEHNAIFQCLPQTETGVTLEGVSRIVLTASGGPFLNTPEDQLSNVSPEQACAHPNWSMGRKISVDSATLMNKGLEVIEASLLFSIDAGDIDVVVHPQSVIHSMVTYVDGSTLAQLGTPDMRTPIASALAWPDRIESGVSPLDFTRLGDLSFYEPDTRRFPCLGLAYDSLNAGGNMSAVMNAANEVAVDAFLHKRTGFTQIPRIVERVMNGVSREQAQSVDEILDVDSEARRFALGLIDSPGSEPVHHV